MTEKEYIAKFCKSSAPASTQTDFAPLEPRQSNDPKVDKAVKGKIQNMNAGKRNNYKGSKMSSQYGSTFNSARGNGAEKSNGNSMVSSQVRKRDSDSIGGGSKQHSDREVSRRESH